MRFGDLLRNHRHEARLTQEELAERAQLSERAVQDLERGVRTRPRRDTIRLLVAALGLDDADRQHFERLARDDGAGEAPSQTPSNFSSQLGQVSHPQHRLPWQISNLIGRDRELSELRDLVQSARLLTLSGTGGIGKTRLALELAHLIQSDLRDGGVFADLAHVAHSSDVPREVARAFGLVEQAGDDLVETMSVYVGSLDVLLLIDNCEHVVEAAAILVEQLLRACPKLRVIATSREPLRIAGEITFTVTGLATPAPGVSPSVDQLRQLHAVELFIERARSARSTFTLTSANAQAVAAICRQLDGIPLAIELAAARVTFLSASQIAERLQHRFDILVAGDRTALPHHQTLRALVDWSYELLSNSEQIVFQRLSVFAGGWTLDAAESVCGCTHVARSAVVEVLGELVSKSMVIADEISNGQVVRYRLLETLREYAWDRLLESAEASDALELHARLFAALASAAGAGVLTRDQLGWVARLEPEEANLRAVLSRIRDGVLSPELAEEIGPTMAWHLSKFWQLRGQLADGAEWTTSIGEWAPRRTPAAALTLAMAAYFQLWTGHADSARAVVRQAIEIAEELQDPEALAWAHYMHLVVCLFAGSFDQAEAEGQLAIAQAEAAGIAWLRASARITLGANLLYKRQTEQAAGFLSEGQELAIAEGERFVMGLAAMYLGHLAVSIGDDPAAEVHYQRSLKVLQEAECKSVMLTPANHLAEIALKRGDGGEALWRYGRTLELAMTVGRRDAIGNALAGIGMALVTAGDARFAAVLFGVVEALRLSTGIPPAPAGQALEAHFVGLMQSQLGEPAFTAALGEGSGLELFEACDAALDRVEGLKQ